MSSIINWPSFFAAVHSLLLFVNNELSFIVNPYCNLTKPLKNKYGNKVLLQVFDADLEHLGFLSLLSSRGQVRIS